MAPPGPSERLSSCLDTYRLIGIGFIAVITGAVAERFLATEFEEVAEATHEVGATETDVLVELREVRNRLERLEARLAGRSRAQTAEN